MMVKSKRIAMGLAVVLAATIAGSVGCNRKPSAVRDMMKKLSGSWVWRGAGSSYTTVVVLELTTRGKYTRTTYAEMRGEKKRRLLYFNQYRAEFEIEPAEDDPKRDKKIAELKKERFEPAVEEGRYILDLEEPASPRVTFEPDAETTAVGADGVGSQNQPITYMQESQQLRIGGKVYTKDTTPPAK